MAQQNLADEAFADLRAAMADAQRAHIALCAAEDRVAAARAAYVAIARAAQSLQSGASLAKA